MATNTYVALDKKTVASAVESVEFTSIPQGYTDLVLVANTQSSSGSTAGFIVQFNGDTTSSYSRLSMSGSGTTTASSDRNTNASSANMGSVSGSMISVNILQVMNYSNSTTYKALLNRSNTPNDLVRSSVGTWRKTEPITSIKIIDGNTSFAAGSTFSLYGIAAVGASLTPKATGGVIYSDDTYYYHAFGASGTFTPTQSLTADVLCVAGGGGGGTANRGGGGGAGGIIYFASQSLTATGYSITVGAGGSQFGQGNNSQFASLTVASGGGRGGASNFGGAYLATAGGSGGGNGNDGTNNGGASNQSGTGATSYYGNRGGNVTVGGDVAGGGGAGAAGTDGVNSNNGIAGGAGTSAFSSWGSATGLGEISGGNYYIAAGGAGGANYSGGGSLLTTRALGGGGVNSTNLLEASGLQNTGSGGSGFSYNSGSGTFPAGYGGSGIVLVRYAKA